MSDVPAENYPPSWATERVTIPTTGGDRDLLVTLLGYHGRPSRRRATGSRRSGCGSGACRRRRSACTAWCGTSPGWSAGGSASSSPARPCRCSSTLTTSRTWTSTFGDDPDPVADLATWRPECAAAREVVAARDLDATGTRRRDGSLITVRFVLAHLIAEYARHNGHADLLRERLDGRTGA